MDRHDTGWTYDAAGNLIDDQSQTSTYDARGRMLSAGTATYQYNGDGVLTHAVENGTTTSYVQDTQAGLSQILAMTTNGATTNALYGHQRLATVTNGAYTWLLHDRLGSTRMELDSAGTPLAVPTYDPWGQLTTSGSTPFGFTGELQNPTTGLIHLRARWYQPSSGTLVGRDPFSGYQDMPYSLHPYQYAYSQPTLYTDPSGLCPQPPSGSGDVLCVDLFIADARILRGTGHGDGRDFSPRSDPEKSRGYMYIYLDEQGKVTNEELNIAASCINVFEIEPLSQCFGPYMDYNSMNVTPLVGGRIQVDWHMLNGVSALAQSQSKALMNDFIESKSVWDLLGAGLFWCIGAPLAAIDGTIVLNRTAQGEWYLESMDRDPYPSLEIYHYKNGQPWSTIVLDREAEWGPLFNLTPIAENRREPHWRADPRVLRDPPARWLPQAAPLPPGFVHPVYTPPPPQPVSG